MEASTLVSPCSQATVSAPANQETVIYLEDDPVQQNYVATTLERDHMVCLTYTTAEEIKQAFVNETPCDVVLLDWDLGTGESGLEVVHYLKATQVATLPIIILSSRGVSADIVTMLNAGATDFLCKPVTRSKLLQLIKAYLPKGEARNAVRAYGDYRDHTEQQRFTIQNRELDLSPSAYRLASLLFRSSDQLVTHRMIKNVLNQPTLNNVFQIESYMHRLKKKLRLKESGLFRLVEFHGYGYRLTQVNTG